MNTSSVGNDVEKKFIQVSPASIELIADSIGCSDTSTAVLGSLAEDSSYRVRELIQSCLQILRHSKRLKLTKDDVDLALGWSDVPRLHGQHSQLLDFHHIPEADIYTPLDLAVDLTQDYPGRGGVEVFSSMKLNTQYLILDSEDKLKTEVYSQYFEKLAQSLLSTSDGLVEVALTNLQENSRLQPLLHSLTQFLRNVSDYSHENGHLVRRIPLIFNALMNNPHLNIEPEQSGFIQLLEDLLLKYNESSLDEDTYHLLTSISLLLAKLASYGAIHVEVAGKLGGIIADPSSSIIMQCRATLALGFLSSKYLDAATGNHWKALWMKLHQKREGDDTTLYMEEILINASAAVLRYRIHLINELLMAGNADATSSEQLWKGCGELYSMASELLGFSAVRVGPFPENIYRQVQADRREKMGETYNELYWTVKCRHKVDKGSKWQYVHMRSAQHASSKKTELKDVFELHRKTHENGISFHVRNWKQRPTQLLRKKTLTSPKQGRLPSTFAKLSYTNLKVFSKTFSRTTSLPFYEPVNLIL